MPLRKRKAIGQVQSKNKKKKQQRKQETSEERNRRLATLREKATTSRASETEEQREKRLQDKRDRANTSRASEQQRQNRLQDMRNRATLSRNAKKYDLPVSGSFPGQRPVFQLAMAPKRTVTETLVMDCEIEDLSPAQIESTNAIQDKIDLFKKRIELLSLQPDTVIEKTADVTFLEFMGLTAPLAQQAVSAQMKAKIPRVQNPASSQQSNSFVLVDSNMSNLGLVVSSMSSSPPTPTSGARLQSPSPAARNTPVNKPAPKAPVTPRMRGTGSGTAVRQRGPLSMKARLSVPATPRGGFVSPFGGGPPPPPLAAGRTKPRPGLQEVPIAPAPKESPPLDVVDLTDEDGYDDPAASKADSKEVTFRNSEKTFPSLVVLARAFLSPKSFTNPQATAERSSLDAKVKQVLMLPTPQLTEWLLQHGMLRSEQTCPNTSLLQAPTTVHTPLKLGMYSDATKFPYSGGYVWISECCPTQFVSVFSGSLFEATPNPPTVILKLIYHWACQTGVQNVIQWVKVDNLYVKTLYTNLRAVCTSATHQKFGLFGGPGKRVQVGVISLGTSTHDGVSKSVKVEILGVFDEATKYLRIRAIDPLVGSDLETDPMALSKKRFKKTLECLPMWVHKASEVIIDHTVDKAALTSIGYPNVVNAHPSSAAKGDYQIMEYLRKIIPRMFQNTLSLLSRQIIQQFLDELVWREAFGPIPSRAFESIIEHISEQTRLNTGGTLMNRLSRISMNPFKNWKYDKWSHNCKAPVAPKVPQPAQAASPVTPPTPLNIRKITLTPQIQKVMSSSSPRSSGSGLTSVGAPPGPAMIALEPYYYGSLPGDPVKQKSYPFFSQCYVCSVSFKNSSKLTDHLILHALNKNPDVADPKDVCKNCLKVWPPGSRQHHLQLCQQQQSLPGPECKICCLKLRDKGSLVYHMTKTHHQLDMPYHCERCGCRDSVLEAIVTHYNKEHKNSAIGMCPFCLKMVDFATPDGQDLEHNQIFFIKHIQRHVLPTSKKCSRCLLNFVNKSVLSTHEVVMHASCSDIEDVQRHGVEEPTLMPAPIIEPPLVHSLRNNKNPGGSIKGIGCSVNQALSSIDCPEDYLCHECESPMSAEHFRSFTMCNKCFYKTSCVHAMAEHASLIHPPYPLSSSVFVGMKTILKQAAYCNGCNFSSYDGNTMSTHLVRCKEGTYCITAKRPRINYTNELSQESTSSCDSKGTKKSNVGNTDPDKATSKEPKTVLNSLGLVRKSSDEEASPMDTTEQEKEGEMDTMVIDSSDEDKDMDCEDLTEKMSIDSEDDLIVL